MFTLDSDFLGILLALLTFLVPAISALFEKKRKKGQNAEGIVPDDDTEEDLFSFILGDETLDQPCDCPNAEAGTDSAYEIAGDLHETVDTASASVVEPEAIDNVPQQLEQTVQPVQTRADEEVSNTVPQESRKDCKSLKERIKENPEEMILFSEILKPKFKEY